MQVELMFVDAPRGDLLAARAAVLGLAGAVAVRGRAPIAAAAVALAVITVLERLDPAVDANLVGPFFSALLISYSVGAHTEGRRLLAGVAVLVLGSVVAIRLDDPPGGPDAFVFAGTIIVGGPVMIGRLVRSRTEVNRALRERAAAAAADSAAAAVADERARIAGELHHLVRDALT